jgi:hypothetical protein
VYLDFFQIMRAKCHWKHIFSGFSRYMAHLIWRKTSLNMANNYFFAYEDHSTGTQLSSNTIS